MGLREMFPQRDAAIRKFIEAYTRPTGPVDNNLGTQFHEAVVQIASRKALRMGCRGEEVTHVVEETVIGFLEKIADGSFRPGDAPVASYVTQAAGWRALHLHERGAVRARRETDDPEGIWIDRQAATIRRPVEDSVEFALAIEEIARAVDELPPEQQEVMRLVPYYTHKEIRQMFGITDSALRNRLLRARRTLREKLNGHENGS